MDAKPQRLRTLRIHDENALPAQPMPTKTIHQRNKSTPALPLLMQGGGVRAAAKRAPFVDLSNTQRTQPAKDDSAINGKATSFHVQDLVTKHNALSKPAQRPLAVKSSSQQIITSNSAITTVPIKPAASEAVAARAQPAPIRSLQPKKSAIVLKDITSVKEPEATSTVSDAVRETQKPFTTEDLLAQLKESNAAQSSAIDGVILPPAVANRHLTSQIIVEEPATTLPELVAPKPVPSHHLVQESSALNSQGSYQPLLNLQQQTRALEAQLDAAINHKQVDDQLIYGDEEDEELYYEEGYTTSRSLRMRGDTTGGATIVLLAPKYTAKVKAEIAAAKELVESSRTEDEIEDESWDTSMVAEYGDEIFDYMRKLEDRMRPNPHYMDHQTECQWSMRAVLMDWLVQVHARFQLLPETLFLSVNYIDRFLSCKVVSLAKLQLVGATAIFLAAKYEEVNCPSISEIVYMVDNSYCQEEILKAERFMLSMLAFELGWPGPMSFLRRISKADDYDLETRTLAKYFLEVTIMDERFVGSTPSFLAAGAHCLARLMLNKGDWSPAHVYYSNYTYSQLRPLLNVMVECCEDPVKHHGAVFEKYQDKRYKRASLYAQSQMQNGFRLPSTARASSHSWTDNSQGWRRAM